MNPLWKSKISKIDAYVLGRISDLFAPHTVLLRLLLLLLPPPLLLVVVVVVVRSSYEELALVCGTL